MGAREIRTQFTYPVSKHLVLSHEHLSFCLVEGTLVSAAERETIAAFYVNGSGPEAWGGGPTGGSRSAVQVSPGKVKGASGMAREARGPWNGS